jgi:hypothetical protein
MKMKSFVLLVAIIVSAHAQAQGLPVWTSHTTLAAFTADEKTRIVNLADNVFVPLTDDEVVQAGIALGQLYANDAAGAAYLQALGYLVYTFNPAGKSYYLVREPSGAAFRGLGTHVINRAPVTNTVVHGKHIATDTKSHLSTLRFFEELGAVAMAWTGVTRCSSSTLSPCISPSVFCNGGDRISDANRFHQNMITASTLAAQARGAITFDVHSNSTEVKSIVLGAGGTLSGEPLAFLTNRIRDRLVATSALSTGACEHPGDSGLVFCGEYLQMKICNGLTPGEACAGLDPASSTETYVQVELRSVIVDSLTNTRTLVNAIKAELPQ